MKTTEIIGKLNVVMLDITLWTARKKLSTADLKLADGSELPPDKLASLGSKRVMNPESLAPFHKLKRRAERETLAVGTRFLGGYAVPEEKLDELMNTLNTIKAEFLVEKTDFLADYQNALDTWVDDNPGWEDVIRNSVESEDYVRQQIQFAVRTFRIQPVEQTAHHEGLEEEVGGLAAQLRKEVSQMVKTAWEASYAGKIEVGQKAVRPIRAALEKAKGLNFLDAGIGHMIESVEETLNDLPKTGPIKGMDFSALCGAIHLLADIPEARHLQLNPPIEEDEEETPSVEAQPTTPQPHISRRLPPEAVAAKRVAVVPTEWF
ncbi:DUF3150 domain-containing protein [Geoalkalibacter halelectricus]|uniref:DUF3150 domain-containing protein n=1 Tax=Geoalkalibacter halelectricus TaxID=2847045 RepID=UPI00266FE1F7|nr:DUF3150 domain-containing protein [Geoalkalibacter halelectricus]MDO3380414.1 DUF3150 domain-containing protein [Geoalkalibacter halelectricus]